MQPRSRLSQGVQDLLRCPVCRARMKQTEQQFECANSACASRFPVVDGIPVLINEQSSLFSIDDFVSHRRTFFANVGEAPRKRIVPSLKLTIGKNIKGKSNFDRMADVLFAQSTSPRVLVLGGSVLGQGMEPLAGNGAVELVETDVAFGARTMLICDAHDIPFENGTFDGVVAQAVLEHVVDPYRCCEEIHRVLRDRGVVYAETPFMQQVHSRYDFTRFTRLGHRRLFRRFEEIDSGAVGGPGMALAWSYKYFLMSGTESRPLKRLIRAFAGLTSFYLKYFDYYLIDKPSALDAASGYYFMGRKAERVLSDRELMKLYKGSR